MVSDDLILLHVFWKHLLRFLTIIKDSVKSKRGNNNSIVTEEKQYKKSTDLTGSELDGRRNYKMHLPSEIPVCRFWSVIVYDNETGLIISTGQAWPSVHSQSRKLRVNHDGSVDIWFGPMPDASGGENWIKTIPGKGWNMILRLYGIQEPGFERRWTPGEIEPLQ
ncbi:DUF1214 domain-containing protein [bacterium]|nr:DUF1214 domain-containing protein [bacterium]